MADVLDAHDFTATQHGNAKYPWTSWTNGDTWKIKQGEDFYVNPSVMLGQVKVRASVEGRKAVARVDGKTVVFTFQRLSERLEDFAQRTTTEVLGNLSDRILAQLAASGPRTAAELADDLVVDAARASRSLTYLASRKGGQRVERLPRTDGEKVWALTAHTDTP